MKALFTKRSIFIATIAVLIAVVTIVSVNVFNSSGPVTGIAGVISGPLRTLSSEVARVFENLYSSIYRYEMLMAEYEKNLQKLTQYERDNRESIKLREENERLRALFDFREYNSGYEYEPVTIRNRSGDNWSHSFTINKGYENSKITKGNGVSTEYGLLVGQVSEVGATTSTVITILDTTFSAGAYVGDSPSEDAPGGAIVKGDFSLMRSGLLMLDRIDDNLAVLRGDIVVTSGVAGVFPVGLVVGEVVDIHQHSTGIGRYATVKPMIDIDTITYVFVITDFEPPDQIEEELGAMQE